VPALPTYLIEPIWEQFSALLPEREVDHPLGCHRSRVARSGGLRKARARFQKRNFRQFIYRYLHSLGPVAYLVMNDCRERIGRVKAVAHLATAMDSCALRCSYVRQCQKCQKGV
jgi:hypothetical protein